MTRLPLELIDWRHALDADGFSWHWLQGSYTHLCAGCGRTVPALWRQGESGRLLCPLCVYLRPMLR